MALPGGMSVMFLAALCAQAIGLLLHIIGLATPGWSVADYGSNKNGLWEGCNSLGCYSYGGDIPSEYEACQAFALIGMILGFIALVFALLYVILPAMGKSANGNFPLISMAVAICALISVLICVIVWGAKIHDPVKSVYSLGYSFGLSIAGGILMAIGGVLAFVGRTQFIG